MTDSALPDEGPAMTGAGLIATTAFLLSCGVHPDDLGEAWSYVREVQYEAEYPSQMGALVKALWEYADARRRDRDRAAAGLVGRHTGTISTT